MDPLQKLIEIAESYVGVREQTGHNDGSEVERFQSTTGGRKGDSWCMDFVQTCVKEASEATGIPSTLYLSGNCLTVWGRSSNRVMPDEAVLPGYVIIWQHRGTTEGHTGIVTAIDGDTIQTVEGNTSDGSGVNREGDGVYARTRSLRGSGSMDVVGFVNPF